VCVREGWGGAGFIEKMKDEVRSGRVRRQDKQYGQDGQYGRGEDV
jgi:hypothetical protein